MMSFVKRLLVLLNTHENIFPQLHSLLMAACHRSSYNNHAILRGVNKRQVFDFETYIDSTEYEKYPEN